MQHIAVVASLADEARQEVHVKAVQLYSTHEPVPEEATCCDTHVTAVS